MSSAGSASDKLQHYNPHTTWHQLLVFLVGDLWQAAWPQMFADHLTSVIMVPGPVLHFSSRETALTTLQLNRCGKVSRTQRVTIKPNEQVVVRGFIDKCHSYHQTCALLQPHPQVSSDLDLTPSLISYRYKDTDPVEVTFSNLSTHTVTLNPKTVLCEVQPITITTLEETSASDQQDPLLSQVDLESENLSKEQQVNGKKVNPRV